jgi:hypothetical protein
MSDQVGVAHVRHLGIFRRRVHRRPARRVRKTHPAPWYTQSVRDSLKQGNGLDPPTRENLGNLRLLLPGGERDADLRYPRFAQDSEHGRDIAAGNRTPCGWVGQ